MLRCTHHWHCLVAPTIHTVQLHPQHTLLDSTHNTHYSPQYTVLRCPCNSHLWAGLDLNGTLFKSLTVSLQSRNFKFLDWIHALLTRNTPSLAGLAHPLVLTDEAKKRISLLTLRAQHWSRLRIQSLLYRSQGPLRKDYFRTTIFFPANFVTLLAVIWLDGEHYFSAGMYTPNNIKL